MKRLTSEEFTRRATEVHKGKYTYGNVVYINSKVKIEITCPIHGNYKQIPNDHLMGKGCSECYKDCANNHLKMGLEQFINKSNEVHNNKYNYSKIVYNNARTKVEIICPEHGSFFQVPYFHLNGSKCPKCNRRKVEKSKVCKTELFITKSKSIWGNDTFDYSNVKYVNRQTKIILICKKHNVEFGQVPSNHLNGNTCCSECLFEKTGRYKNGYWDYNRCYEVAKKYEWLSDFAKSEPKCYDACKEKGWISDFHWLKRHYDPDEDILTARKHLIYKYEFPEFNCVYIGLTLNLERRHKRGHCKSGSVFEFCQENSIEMSEPVIIEDKLTLSEVKEKEQQWIDYHKGLGYTLLNRRDGGSVGVLCNCKTGNETELFIEKAQKVHSGRYDYSKVDYKNSRTKVCIICSKHGEFWQKPNNHINLGRGCPSCGREKTK